PLYKGPRGLRRMLFFVERRGIYFYYRGIYYYNVYVQQRCDCVCERGDGEQVDTLRSSSLPELGGHISLIRGGIIHTIPPIQPRQGGCQLGPEALYPPDLGSCRPSTDETRSRHVIGQGLPCMIAVHC